jgi:N-acetylglucosamine-6-sulfatase
VTTPLREVPSTPPLAPIIEQERGRQSFDAHALTPAARAIIDTLRASSIESMVSQAVLLTRKLDEHVPDEPTVAMSRSDDLFLSVSVRCDPAPRRYHRGRGLGPGGEASSVETRRGAGGGRTLDTVTSRRSALRSIGAGLLGLRATLGGRADGSSAAPNARPAAARLPVDPRPNIILIVGDDMRADDLADMPSTQELLVGPGMRFAQCFASAPSCAPSRASILRGQYPHNHGVLRGSEKQWGFGRFHDLGNETSTIATWLQGAGYRTALVGKYLNNYPRGATPTYIPPGWDEWTAVTEGNYEDFELNADGTLVSFPRRDQAYQTDVLATTAADFIARTARSAAPFFLYLAPRAAHSRPIPPPRHAGTFAAAPVPRPPSFDVRGGDKSLWAQREPALNAEATAKVDATYRARKETLLGLDDLIAELIATLEAAGILDTTYIILTSDNGLHLGEHRIIALKGTAYEEVIRVPLVIRGPGVAPGNTTALASVIDLAPTIATWAGAEIPAFVDGRSLTGVLDGEPAPWRQAVLIQHHRDNPNKVDGPPAFHALRGEGFVYVEEADGVRELYELTVDPFQLTNLAATADAGVVATLSDQLAMMATCIGPECRAIESSPLPSGISLR